MTMRNRRTAKKARRYKKPARGVRILYKILWNILIFAGIQGLVFGTFSFGMVYYGPFENIREMLVTSAMTTLSHQYIATWFLSDKEINRIMEKNKVDDADKKSDIAAIEIVEDEPVQEEVKEEKKQVELVDVSTDKYKGYLLIIPDPKQISLAVSDKIGKVGMKLVDMAKQNDALGGINAGGFEDINGKGNGGTPQGMIIQDGKVIFGKENTKYAMIGFNADSVLVLGRYTLKEAREMNMKDAVTFEPFLIVNGEPMIKTGNGGWGLAPRTAIGQRKDGTVLMLVIDGRQLSSVGATLKEVQDIMLEYGAYNAANLDGGSSTTMVYQDKLINNPCSQYGPRYLPSAFIIKKD